MIQFGFVGIFLCYFEKSYNKKKCSILFYFIFTLQSICLSVSSLQLRQRAFICTTIVIIDYDKLIRRFFPTPSNILNWFSSELLFLTIDSTFFVLPRVISLTGFHVIILPSLMFLKIKLLHFLFSRLNFRDFTYKKFATVH